MMNFVNIILEVLWFFLPAMAANMAPVFAARYQLLPRLAHPLDGGRSFRGERILGDNKTVRGTVFSLVMGILAAYLQAGLFMTTAWAPLISRFSYHDFVAVGTLGLLLGAGALLGDAFKSFIKRRLHIRPGHSFPVMDQIDYVLGAIIATRWMISLPVTHIVVALLVLGFGSLLASLIGVTIGIKKSL